MTYAADAPVAKPGPRLWLSIVVMVVGAALGITGIALFAGHAVHDINNLSHYDGTIPTDAGADLTSGTWQVYVDEGSSPDRLLTATDVTVTSPSGTNIPTRAVASDLTEYVTLNGAKYVGEVRFDVPSGGEYRIAVNGPQGTKILLAKTLGDVVKHSAGWLALFGLGAIVGLAGLIMLIVGIVRRRGARAPAPAYAGGYAASRYPVQAPTTPAAGWYPDPSSPNLQRYWDGTKWTDQTHSTQ